MSGAGFSLRARALVALALALVVVALTAFLGVLRLHERTAESAGFQALRGVAEMYSHYEQYEQDKLSAALDVLVKSPDLRAAFAERDVDRLMALAEPRFDLLRKRSNVTHWYFIGPDRKVVLRVHKPELRGDVVTRKTLERAAVTGDIGAGKELGRTAFAIRVVRAMHDGSGRVVGYMELAEEIDHFLSRLKAKTGDEFALLVSKEFLEEEIWTSVLGKARNTWNDRPDAVLVDTTSFSQGIADFQGDISAIPEEGLALGEVLEDGQTWLRGAFPVRDVAGRRVGALFVLHDFTKIHGLFAAGRLRGAFVVVGLALAVFAILALLFERLVFGRLGRLRRIAEERLRVLPEARGVAASPEFFEADEVRKVEILLTEARVPGLKAGD